MNPTQNESDYSLTWENIPGFAGYQINKLGEVRGLERRVPGRRGIIKERLLSTREHKGYRAVQLGRAHRYVHNLVLLTFKSPRPKGCVPRFDDGDTMNCHVDNLSYESARGKARAADAARWHVKVGAKCSKGHELVGDNVRYRNRNRICLACDRGEPAVRELPEII